MRTVCNQESEQRSAVTPELSVVVCTVRPLRCAALLRTLSPYASHNEIIVVVDGGDVADMSVLHGAVSGARNIRLVIVPDNQGLSPCRNLGIALASNRCILFLDDDVQLTSDIIDGYRKRFLEGYHIVGGPLRLPACYPTLPWWLPPGLSYLMGVHADEYKIWGGNFGFARVDGGHPQFRAELGRKGKGLQSGDDTSFVKDLLASGDLRQCFATELAVEHHIELSRYNPSYLARRAYWQGRSEVRRQSAVAGLANHARRAAARARLDSTTFVRIAVGAGLLGCFLAGMLYEALMQIDLRLWGTARR
jgi:glycosyltransferase involved in cell wall biosynthesis